MYLVPPPIRGQYPGHVITLDQSEASIQVTMRIITVMYLVSLTDSNAVNEIYFVELVQAGGKVKVNLWKIVAKTDSWIWLVFGIIRLMTKINRY